jgi:hypothetical protein
MESPRRVVLVRRGWHHVGLRRGLQRVTRKREPMSPARFGALAVKFR